MKKIALFCVSESQLSAYIEKAAGVYTQRFDYDTPPSDLSGFDSLCFLGGTEEKPFVLPPSIRIAAEEFMNQGGRVFAEYLLSIGQTYADVTDYTRHKRLIYTGSDYQTLSSGDILDDQCNRLSSFYYKLPESYPLLIMKDYINAHAKTEYTAEEKENVRSWALWHHTENLLICGIRLCFYADSRLSPLNKWGSVLKYVVDFLSYGEATAAEPERGYSLESCGADCVNDRIPEALCTVLSYFEKSGILIDEGKGGVREGFGHDIYPDGSQKAAEIIRADCVGEVSGAFLLNFLAYGNKKNLRIFRNLQEYLYSSFQINGGLFDGMLRWSNVAWGVCYQDDVARAILPSLYYMYFTGNEEYRENTDRALAFLLRTTGSDGLRVARTDNFVLSEKEIEHMRETAAAFPCAHYNAYYFAALLLSHLTKPNSEFFAAGVRGLEAIMAVFPDTVREQSETEELCRLVFPLSVLYMASGDDKHKKWLYDVTEELVKHKTPQGAYYEWDTGYKAACAQRRDSECSLLTQNGDPVVDMLYSINWLTVGFAFARQATGDKQFDMLWREIAAFFVSVQIHSERNGQIDGCWTRAFDVERGEVFGVPHDVGWGPWAVESGWTVAEIAMGLALGKILDWEK